MFGNPVQVAGGWWSTCSHTLQMIMLERCEKNPTALSYINNTYDFNVCKNIYKIKDGKHVLKINNLSSIMNKEIQLDANNMGKNGFARNDKYLRRGFKFRQENYDYIKYMNRVIPIIYCDVEDEKMSNIYFLGKRMKTNKWRNDNVTIKYFSKDMYSDAYTCHYSGLAHSYNKKGNLLIRTGIFRRDNMLRCCPMNNYYDESIYEHRHSTMTMRKKKDRKRILL